MYSLAYWAGFLVWSLASLCLGKYKKRQRAYLVALGFVWPVLCLPAAIYGWYLWYENRVLRRFTVPRVKLPAVVEHVEIMNPTTGMFVVDGEIFASAPKLPTLEMPSCC